MEIDELLKTNNWFNYQEFYEWVSKKPFKTFVEVGVWKGHSISYLADKLRNTECEIFAVDLFDKTYRYDNPEYKHLKDQVPHIKDIYNKNLTLSSTRDMIKDIQGLSWVCAEEFDDYSLDFVFIDADHTYESVLKDIYAWYTKVRTGGILSGHDYSSWSGVKMAVDKFTKENDYKLQKFKGDVWFIEIN
jgi:predicted O-methyltransferase YrrM